jgi:phospholipid/cholesterol/gamma-HCH transport system substrate-binding protein
VRRTRKGMPNVLAGLLLLAVVVVGVAAAFHKRNPFADRFELRLAFTQNTALRPGAPVRVAGVDVGEVRRIEPAPGSPTASIVTIEVREVGLPLHADATFKARPRIFLEGNDFLDVRPGSPSAPELGDGDTVSARQTAARVSVFEVLEILKRDGREDLRTVLDEFGRALSDGGAEGYNRSIRWWKEAYRDGAIVAEASLGERDGDLRRYLRSAATVAAALDRDPRALRGFVRDLATTAGALASEQEALAEAIGELPSTLRVGHRALGSLNDAFPSLRRFVADLRPAVRSSGPALDAQLPLVRELRGLVRPAELRGLAGDLRRLVPDLVELNEGGVALQRQARLLGSCQLQVIGPWQRDRVPGFFPSAGRVFEEGVKWLPGIAAESRNFDGNGQYIRSQPNGGNLAYDVGGGQLLLAGQPLRGVLPPKAPQPPLRADVPCETQERPDLRARPGALPRAQRVATDSPAARERRERLMRQAARILERDIRARGLQDELRVSRTPLQRSQLQAAAREARR